MSVRTDVLERAFKGEARGESLIAVGLDKRPWYGWKRYQAQRATPAQLAGWAKHERASAFALVTGSLSGVVVLDFDERGIGLIDRHGLRPHVRTGSGGYHLRVRHPGFPVATQNSKVTKRLAAEWPGLDVRGDGGYAIQYGASSIGAYEPLRDLADVADLDEIPEEMAAAVGLLGPPEGDTGEEEIPDSAERGAGGKFHTGHRHRHLITVACAMAGRGHSEAEILAELRRVNAVDCEPPHGDAKLRETAKDIAARYGNGRPAEPDHHRADLQRLDAILRFTQHGTGTREVALIGDGPSAGIEIHLLDGRTLEAERFGDLWTHTGLARFITQSTGINACAITGAEAGEANAIMRRLAVARSATRISDLGTDNGVDFLSRASVLDADLTDQAQRYAAFERLHRLDPVRASDPRTTGEAVPATVADASEVIRHTDGSRIVRCDWLFAHVRRNGETSSPAELARRMEHAGWSRRGTRGRIKATSPSGFGPPIVLPFWIVPAGWEESL